MDYGFWLLLFDGWGHSEDFRGPSDVLMAFWFYLPNLLVAELFIRARRGAASPALRLAAAGLLLAATGFLLLGTYFFTLFLLCSVVALAHSSALHGSPFPLSSPMCPFTQCEANHVSPPESTYGE